MSDFQIKALVPMPLRSFLAPIEAWQLWRDQGSKQTNRALLESKEGKEIIAHTQAMLRTIMRVGLLGIGWYLSSTYQWTPWTMAGLGVVSSLPSVMLVGGSYALSFGARCLLDSIGTGSLLHLFGGFASIGIGTYTLDQHEIFSFGLLDHLIRMIAKDAAPHFTELFMS